MIEKEQIPFYVLNRHRGEVLHEITVSQSYVPVEKDILIVVHDQPEYIENCLRSIEEHTKLYNIYLWDNASGEKTVSVLKKFPFPVVRSEENQGFIVPNNELIKLGCSPYVILLNTDVEVRKGWDESLIAWLQTHSDVAEVGFQGCVLDENFKGGALQLGYNIHYVCGWCACFSRETYEQFGLFDQKNLNFAYCEDADFSLRLLEAGKKIYATYSSFATHYENKTILAVDKERDLRSSFDHNHAYIKKRWETFLSHYEFTTSQD